MDLYTGVAAVLRFPIGEYQQEMEEEAHKQALEEQKRLKQQSKQNQSQSGTTTKELPRNAVAAALSPIGYTEFLAML